MVALIILAIVCHQILSSRWRALQWSLLGYEHFNKILLGIFVCEELLLLLSKTFSSTLKAEITKNVKVLLVESNTNFAWTNPILFQLPTFLGYPVINHCEFVVMKVILKMWSILLFLKFLTSVWAVLFPVLIVLNNWKICERCSHLIF
jgi:hypothetical protein